MADLSAVRTPINRRLLESGLSCYMLLYGWLALVQTQWLFVELLSFTGFR